MQTDESQGRQTKLRRAQSDGAAIAEQAVQAAHRRKEPVAAAVGPPGLSGRHGGGDAVPCCGCCCSSSTPTASMETTIPTRSLVVGWRQFSHAVADLRAQRGAIVTFWNDEEGEVLVKRVVGSPGGDGVLLEWRRCVYRRGAAGEDLLIAGGRGDPSIRRSRCRRCCVLQATNREWSKDSRLLQEPYTGGIQGRMLAFSIGSGQLAGCPLDRIA